MNDGLTKTKPCKITSWILASSIITMERSLGDAHIEMSPYLPEQTALAKNAQLTNGSSKDQSVICFPDQRVYLCQ